METEELIKLSVLKKKDIDEKDKDKIYYLDILIKDYSDIRTKLYIFPNKNVTEESAKKQYYRLKDLKLIAFRLKLLIMFVLKFKNINDYVFYYKYPN